MPKRKPIPLNKITLNREELPIDFIEFNLKDFEFGIEYYETIFQHTDGKIYSTILEVSDYDLDLEDELECVEVEKVTKTIEVWQPKTK